MPHGLFGAHLAIDKLPRLFFDDRAFEKVRVETRPQPDGVAEAESVEILLGHPFLFDQLPGLFEHFGHIGHVEVADIGAEDRPQLGAERVSWREGVGHSGIVGFAAEKEFGNE
jgi:hypothetical protein